MAAILPYEGRGDRVSKHRERYAWWGYIKNIIRRYPQLRAEHEAALSPSATADYSGDPHGSGISRPVEQAVIRAASAGTYEEFAAVDRAIRAAQALPNGAETLRLIDLLFWRQTHTLHGAASVVHVSTMTARRRVANFIVAVAAERGLIEKRES